MYALVILRKIPLNLCVSTMNMWEKNNYKPAWKNHIIQGAPVGSSEVYFLCNVINQSYTKEVWDSLKQILKTQNGFQLAKLHVRKSNTTLKKYNKSWNLATQKLRCPLSSKTKQSYANRNIWFITKEKKINKNRPKLNISNY